MNLVDMRIFFQQNDRLFPDCIFLSEIQLPLISDHLSRYVCVNFIKTISQILRNDVIDNIIKFNLTTLLCLQVSNVYKKQDK
jgi:hypothetical protein